jgi:hypothetical protein
MKSLCLYVYLLTNFLFNYVYVYLQPFYLLTDFQETWYKHHAIGGLPIFVIINFLQLAISTRKLFKLPR